VLVARDNIPMTFVWDPATNKNVAVSFSWTGGYPRADAQPVAMSDNGSLAVVFSYAKDHVRGETPPRGGNLYLWSRSG